ncbi:MAG: hypothetical protein SGILL_000490 [Bacillariaceae sp.]
MASFFSFEPPVTTDKQSPLSISKSDQSSRGNRKFPEQRRPQQSQAQLNKKEQKVLKKATEIRVQRTHANKTQDSQQSMQKPHPIALEAEPKKAEQSDADASQSQEQQNTTKEEDDRLNILLLYADDWTMKVLGKFDPNVKTPNIDKMADNGMLFTNNCVTTSVCWISRATLVTGVYYSRHLQFAPHSTNMYRTNPWNETLFPRLKSAGYYTGLMGKWHLPQPQEEMAMSFDKSTFYYGNHWDEYYSPHGSNEKGYITDKNLRDALEFLRDRPKEKPFFLKVSYFATHAWDGHFPSYIPKNETRSKFYPEDMYIEPPKTATQWHWDNLPRFFSTSNEARNRWRRRFEPDYFQDSVKGMYAMATEVDESVGILLEELKQQGVLDKTMIIFTTDNGNLQGEHGLSEKWYPFEESLRVPLVIQDPRMPKAKKGTAQDAWTLSVDLAPTILGAANLEASSFMQGRDLSALYLDNPEARQLRQGKSKWRNDWYYEWNMGDPLNATGHPQTNFIDAAQAVISSEWKYIYWPEQNFEQLFNRRIDPYDEWDPIKKDNLLNTSSFNATADGSLQTTQAAYKTMKSRFLELRDHIIAGGKA